MIDYLHLEITDPKTIDIILQKFEYYTPTNHETGEFKTVSEAIYKNWKIRVYDGRRLELWGSIHKYHNEGLHNANDFVFGDLCRTIQLFAISIGFDPKDAKIRGIEYGVNIQVGHLKIIDLVVCYGKYQVVKMDIANHRASGLSWKVGNYRGKIYDKSLQQNTSTGSVRFEKKVLVMKEIASTQIQYLSDLADKNKLKSLGADLSMMLEDLVIEEPLTVEGLTKPEIKLYDNIKNPRFWEKLNKRMRNHYRISYAKLVEKNGTHQIKKTVLHEVSEKWRYLLDTNSKKCNLFIGSVSLKRCNYFIGSETSNKNKKCNLFLTCIVGKSYIQPFIKSYSKNSQSVGKTTTSANQPREPAQRLPKRCKVTGVRIDHQRQLSIFVSEKTLDTMPEVFEEVKKQRHHRKNARKRNYHSQAYYLGHNKRNMDSNPRNNLRYAIERVLSKTSLFSPKEMIRLSAEQRSILSFWEGSDFDIVKYYGL